MQRAPSVGNIVAVMLVSVLMCDPLCNARAQDWAKERLNKSPRHGEWVDFKSGDRTIKAFVVYPERKEKTPVVLVIHEIDRKSTRLNSSHTVISYAVFCL